MPAVPKTAPKNVLEDYRAAVSANPNSAEAHCNLGWGLYGQGQFADAIKEFQEALNLDTDWVDAYYGLGLAHKGAGAHDAAVAAFQKIEALAPQMTDLVRAHMLVRLSHGQINEIKTGDWNIDKELRYHESA